MSTLYVVRHGQASFGAADYDQLSELGQEQARLTGEYFRDQGIVIDAGYSGSLRRQQDTARLVLEAQPVKPPVVVDEGWNEVRNEEQIEYLLPALLEKDPALRAVAAEGLDDSKRYQKVIAAVFGAWVRMEEPKAPIQSWTAYSSGVSAALERVMTEQGRGRSCAIFTSGGTVAVLVARVLGVPPEGVYQFYEPMFNCSVTQFFYSADRISLSSFNDCSFLRLLGAQRGQALVTYR